MLPKTPSLDSPSKINWTLEDMKNAYREPPCENWDDFAGGLIGEAT